MELDMYKQQVMANYAELPDEEKEVLRGLKQSEVGMILAKVLGPEMQQMMATLADPQPQRMGLGAR